MTQPTQAQIEAARKLLQLSSCFGKEVCVMLPCACAETLTAAAQIEYSELSRLIKSNTDPLHDEIERIEATTIERCAQVAEQTLDSHGIASGHIAAAIRQLKDAP